MKKVLVTQRLVEIVEYGEIRECYDIKWHDFLSECELMPVYLSVHSDIDKCISEFKPVGVILTGGNNLYNAKHGDKLSKMRDDFECKLIQKAISNDIAIIGICRGMQMIAHYFGAKLKRIDGHVATRHKLSVAQESANADVLGNIIDVNSYHQYSVVNVPKDFVVSAKSKDDIIEAIEHKHKEISAYMWHPEREEKFLQHDIDLFRRGLGL